jgi:uncharacterized protein (TIGR02147 family)
MKQVSIWNFEDYKDFLKEFIKELPHKGRGQLKNLAESLSVHPTLISQVVNGEKDFSNEQAYGVTKFLGLTEKETEYFFELILLAKAGSKDLKKYHQKRIQKLSKQGQTVKIRVGDSHELSEDEKLRFYSDWKYMAMWLATSVKGLKDEASLARALNISREEAMEIMGFLLEKNLCTMKENGLAMGYSKTHIPSDSPLVKNHHLNWRLKGLDFVRHVSPLELSFTAPFSVSKKDFALIRTKILDMIQDISKVVSESEPEVVACLNLDHFLVIS